MPTPLPETIPPAWCAEERFAQPETTHGWARMNCLYRSERGIAITPSLAAVPVELGARACTGLAVDLSLATRLVGLGQDRPIKGALPPGIGHVRPASVPGFLALSPS